MSTAKTNATVLLVDDDRPLLEATGQWLEHLGFRVFTARNIEQSLKHLSETPFDLVLSDLRLDQGCGLEILKAAGNLQPNCCLLAMTGYATPDLQVQATQAGAVRILRKPLEDAHLIKTLESILRENKVAKRDQQVSELLDRRFQTSSTRTTNREPATTEPAVTEHAVTEPAQWYGSSTKMQEVFELLNRVAHTKASVLITGEPGTGKSKLARHIHQLSNRRTGPFVEVACGSIPEPLLESELFGHSAGAFTGAMHKKLGKFQYAQGGTLFLDEIATASMAMQVRLLRVLQSRCFEAIGSNETLKTDARMIFATNEDLRKAVQTGRFREDLFYRIHVVPIELPALRHRKEDIRELALGFLDQACRDFDRKIEGFSPAAIKTMLEYPWPGNIRELENTVQRAVLVCLGDRIESRDLDRLLLKSDTRGLDTQGPEATELPPSTMDWSERYRDLDDALWEPERALLLSALKAYGWNRQITASRLGINRTTLYKKMKRLGIESVR